MKSHTQFLTYSGQLVDFANLQATDICISDIAHHLASYKNMRFGGSLPLHMYYSVADHSYYLAKYLLDLDYSMELIRNALMHDATEAYLGDIPTGLKTLLPDYKELEKQLETIIFTKYHIIKSYQVKELDKRIVLDEVMAFRPEAYRVFKERIPYQPLGIVIKESSPQEAFDRFMVLAELLEIKD